MFAKVRKLKDKKVLTVFLEDMKLVKGIISKWDNRIDCLLSEAGEGKENNQGLPKVFQTTLAEILEQAKQPEAPTPVAVETSGSAEPCRQAAAQKTPTKKSDLHGQCRAAGAQKPERRSSTQDPGEPAEDIQNQHETFAARIAVFGSRSPAARRASPEGSAATVSPPPRMPRPCSGTPPSAKKEHFRITQASTSRSLSPRRAYSFERSPSETEAELEDLGPDLNLERFPPSFRTGAAAQELTAVWREFLIAEARQHRREASEPQSTSRRRRVALTVDHLSQRLAYISCERLSLLLEVLQSRRFLVSRRGVGPLGTQILWERAWVWEK